MTWEMDLKKCTPLRDLQSEGRLIRTLSHFFTNATSYADRQDMLKFLKIYAMNVY